MTEPHALAQLFAEQHQPRTSSLLWITVVVHEHEYAVVHRRGRITGVLAPGLHRLWGQHVQITGYDRRRQLLEIPAQELATNDGVTVKVTAQVTWQLIDPLAAITRDADHLQTIYAAAQQALRTVVAARAFDQLSAQRAAIANDLREAIGGEVAAIGLQVHNAALKDVMLTAELRKALAAVALAKQEGLAALEKARGEQAALRILANAARLLTEQPALAQLKGLQVLAEGLRAGATVVVNAGEAGLLPPRTAR